MQTVQRLPNEATDRIAEAVAVAELRTSAEVKVIITRYCWSDIHQKAQTLFHKHGLHQTKDRNAVMILLVLVNREFLVYGDKGIHEKVDDGFWIEVRDAMQDRFRNGELVEGILAGVERVGEQLAAHFPRAENDVNELSDEVVHED